MFTSTTLNKITAILQSVPGMTAEARNQAIQLVSAQLHKLDLVTKEDFEVQKKSLQKTREIVDQLEQKVNELEKQLQEEKTKD